MSRKQKQREYYLKNKETILEKKKQYYINNKVKLRRKALEYYHKQKFLKVSTNGTKVKEGFFPKLVTKNGTPQESIQYKRYRQLLLRAVTIINETKKSKIIDTLKYSASQLQEHLGEMGYDKNIHTIDHLIPVSWFIDDAPPHIVNHLSNLQPLVKSSNTWKGSRFAHPVSESFYHEALPFIKEWYRASIYIDK